MGRRDSCPWRLSRDVGTGGSQRRGLEDLGGIPDGDLLRLCGLHRDAHQVWKEFYRRYQKRIFLYLLRASRASLSHHADLGEQLPDLAQEVYLRLVKNDARILRAFRGSSEFAVRAFLARIATSVVQDYFRYHGAERRKAEVIPIDQGREPWGAERLPQDSGAPSADQVLSQIDFERALLRSETGSNAMRNLLIFKLHYVDGFTAREIAAFPGFRLSVAGVEAVLNRTRTKLRG